MKIFHLSDLHIGLRLLGHDLAEDRRHVFGQIVEVTKKEQPDAIIIAGDIYDKETPAAEATGIFDEFMESLYEAAPGASLMLISGNHDSAVRLNVFRGILSRQHVHMVGLPPLTPKEHIEKVTLTDEWGAVNFYLLPFVRPSMVRETLAVPEGENLSYDETLHRLLEREHIETRERNVFVSHQFYLPTGMKADEMERADSETVSVGGIDAVRADFFPLFDYVALGHIHRPMQLKNEAFRYSGTPLAYSVSERGQEKGIVKVMLRAKGNVSTEKIPLYPLHKVGILEGRLEELLAQGSEDYLRLVVTDEDDLDVLDMQDRLRAAFPNHLEIIRKAKEQSIAAIELERPQELKPLEMMRGFLGELTKEEERILGEVIDKLTSHTL